MLHVLARHNLLLGDSFAAFACVSSCKFHSTPRHSIESHKARVARLAKEKNQQGRLRRAAEAERNKPHVVLGHATWNVSKWLNCDLAKIVISREILDASPELPPHITHMDDLELPRYQAFGIGPAEEHLLFSQLPQVTIENRMLATFGNKKNPLASSEEASNYAANFQLLEKHKAHMLARLTDLRNTNADGLAFENRRRITAAFSEPSQPQDTGRPEVQAALLTMKVRTLYGHLRNAKKDVANVRHLQRLVHQRAKILRYLKRLDFERWRICLDRLALEPEAVEGELNVTMKA